MQANLRMCRSVGNATGDPMVDEAFSVTSDGSSENICQNATTYDGQVHACQDQGASLLLTLCPFNQ